MSLGDDSKRLADLIDSVADGRSIDWDEIDAAGMDDRLRRLLSMLRMVDGIAEVHRSEPGVTEENRSSLIETKEGAAPPGDGSLGHWGHFHLVRKIGEGSFGEVYQARDTWLDHNVALKLVKQHLVDRARFLHEARTLAQIRHPNVVAIHGADQHEGRLGFWMEFIDGHTLADAVEREGVRSASEAALLGQDLCRAMAAVHAANMVHRDIKAQNVMRQSGTGRIVLMDFGAGEAMDAGSARRRPTGTPLYLAPELFDGSIATRETDIYALGVLLFNMVTRSYPVHGASMEDITRAHHQNARHHLGDMRPDLPDSFVRVVETMLSPDPAKRYHTAAAARAALEEVVASADARPIVPAAPQPGAWRRRAYVAALTVVTTVLALIVIGLVSTGAFDAAFSRGAFDTSTLLDWFTIGRKVVFAPVVHMAILAFPLVLIPTAARVFCKLVPPVGRSVSRFSAACYQFLQRRELYDPSLILFVIAGLGALAFGALALYHRSDAMIFALFVDTAPREQLAALQPANEPHYDIFQRRLEYLLLAYGFVVYAVYASVRRTGSRVPIGVSAYVIAVPAFAFLLMRAMPWTVVYGNDLPRVDYGAVRCYALGRRSEETLLFCPDGSPPRVQRHKNGELQDRGFLENVFTPLSQARVFAPASP